MDARGTALEILIMVNNDGAYANLALRKGLAPFSVEDPHEKALVTELVNGTVRYRKRLDYVIRSFSKVPLRKMDEAVRDILRMSVYQLFFLDRIPDFAVVNEAVRLAGEYGADRRTRGFVNGLLRNIVRGGGKDVFPDRKKHFGSYLAVYHSFPEELVNGWIKEYGRENAEKICIYFNTSPPIWLRTNFLRTDRENLAAGLASGGLETVKDKAVPEALKAEGNFNVAADDGFRNGLYSVQDLSSMHTAHALAPRKGEKILDMCAAPGGKACHVAEMTGDRAEIYAYDIHEHRVELIRKNCSRLGIGSVRTDCADALDLEKYHEPESFDRILLDAPCSGTGVLGRRADARWRTAENLEELVCLQKSLLDVAGKLLKPGGMLVYSTCTMRKEENEDVVFGFLKGNRNFRLDSELEKREPFVSRRENIYNKGVFRLLPFSDNTDGFFIAAVRKGEEE